MPWDMSGASRRYLHQETRVFDAGLAATLIDFLQKFSGTSSQLDSPQASIAMEPTEQASGNLKPRRKLCHCGLLCKEPRWLSSTQWYEHAKHVRMVEGTVLPGYQPTEPAISEMFSRISAQNHTRAQKRTNDKDSEVPEAPIRKRAKAGHSETIVSS